MMNETDRCTVIGAGVYWALWLSGLATGLLLGWIGAPSMWPLFIAVAGMVLAAAAYYCHAARRPPAPPAS